MLDLTNVQASGLLAKGEYVASVKTAEVKSTKAMDGEYINCCFETEGGERVFTMFNIKNKNDKAVTIGLQQLKSMMLASGAESFVLNSVNDLLGLKCIIKVDIKEDDFGIKNVIKGYKSLPAREELTSSDSLPF